MEHVTPPTQVPARPTQPTETIPDSTPEYEVRRSPRGMGLSEDFTAEDIVVSVPFDFSFPRPHFPSRGNGQNEGQIEETSLWWYHQTFEAHAKADIRRTLRALLPSDPSHDPSPEDIMDDWRAEVRPRRSGVQIWTEQLEDVSGSGLLDRGLGREPSRMERPAVSTEQDDADGLHPQNSADTVVIANLHRSPPPPNLESPSRNGSPSPEDVADGALHPPDADGVVSVEAANGDISGSEATALTAALTPLVRGKTTLDKTKMVRFIDAPGEVDRVNERGSVAREVLHTSTTTRRVTKKRFRPDDTELMSRNDLPNWKRCAWCARRKVKCAPRVGTQPPYQCFHCEDGERECVPNKKDPRRSGASVRRHPRLAGPSHLTDIVNPALPPEDSSLAPFRRARMRYNERVREVEHARKNLKVARLARKRAFAVLLELEGGPVC